MWFRIAVVFFLLSTTAIAKPFLVCDPQPGVDGYALLANGGEVNSVAVDGHLYYDLADVPVGNNDFSIRAYNKWGESMPVPFQFTRPVGVVAPVNIKIVK